MYIVFYPALQLNLGAMQVALGCQARSNLGELSRERKAVNPPELSGKFCQAHVRGDLHGDLWWGHTAVRSSKPSVRS